MSVIIFDVTTGRPTNFLTSIFETAGGSRQVGQRCVDILQRVVSGNELAMGALLPPSIKISIRQNAVQASGTLTLTTVVAGNTFSINGVTLTGVASGATNNQFNIGVSDIVTAANIVLAITASTSALVSSMVTATSASNVVTITSVYYSLGGNQTTIASGQGTIVASGARLTGGAVDPTSKTLNF